MGKIVVCLILCFLVVNVYASDDVDTFLSAYSTMDTEGYKILLDYRKHIKLDCKRDVTINELKLFQQSEDYSLLLSLRSLSGPDNPDYKKKIISLKCAKKQ